MKPRRETPPRTPPRTASYAAAALLVVLTTALGGAARAVFPVPDLEMLYLLAVMIAAVLFGRGPSLLAAALSVAAYDFFFVPPFHTFAVENARYVLSFAMMFGVGYGLSTLTMRLRRQEQEAIHREERTAALYALSRDLGAALDPEGAAQVTARHAADVFDASAVVLVPDPAGGVSSLGASPPGTTLEASDLGVARWVLEHGRLAGPGTDTLPGSRAVCAPLHIGGASLGVLALVPRSAEAMTADQRGFLDAFCRQATFALERARLAAEARQAALRAKTEQLRSALLSSVSHDLRTPLAAITGAATSLRDDSALAPETRAELLDTVCEETERLERLVSNLLDMTRLESGGVTLKREWVPLVEIVGGALTRLERKLSTRRVKTDLPDDLPLCSVDPVLMEQLFVNLFENATKYTPQGTEIQVRASQEGEALVVEVEDRGPGTPEGDEERIFERFYRGPHAGVSGAGLGLPICRAIAQAHGGTLVASNRAGGGAVFRLTIPATGHPPSVPPAAPEEALP